MEVSDTAAAFEVLFEVLPTSAVLLAPVYGDEAGGVVLDFTLQLLNPAAQRVLRLPARPAATLLGQMPHHGPSGLLARYRAAFASGERTRFDLVYQGDSFDGYYRFDVQRTGELLVVHFTDLAAVSLAEVQHLLREARAQTQRDDQHAERLHQAERRARERHDLYQIFEQTPVAIVLLREPDHRIDYFNPAFAEVFPPERWAGELRGHTLAEVYPRMRETGLVALLDEVYDTGESQTVLEMPLAVLQPGSPRYITFAYQPYREHGVIVGVAAFAYDATEQVRTRQQLEAQQQLLQTLFEQAPFAVVLLRAPNFHVELVNEASAAILGTDRTQVHGRPLFEALPGMRGQGLEEVCAQVLAGQTVVFEELPLTFERAHAGQDPLGYVRVSYQPWRDEQGSIVGVLGVGVEVTAQVTARRTIEASEQRLRLLTDALPVLIAYVDQERRYRFANEAYRPWFDLDPADMLGRHVWEVVGEAAYAKAAAYIDRALAGERVTFETIMPYRPDFVRHTHTNFVPEVQDGQVVGFYTLVSDITGQVEARRQVELLNEELADANAGLRLSNQRLTRTNAELDTFVYTASHDLRSPIANIEGLVTALRQELLDDRPNAPMVEQLLRLIDASITRFQTTIGHLTNVMRLHQSGSREREPVSLAALVADVQLDLAAQLTTAGAELHVDLSECPTLHGSPKDLRSIVFNLLSNAVKYRDPARPPVLHLRSRCDAQWAELQVQDNGLGLTAAQQAKLFKLFVRLHDHVEGTGVGLYSIHKLVTNAGGTVTVTSEPGVGTTFTVRLPA